MNAGASSIPARPARPLAGAAAALRRLRARLPELALVAVGLGIRVSMRINFDARLGYDFAEHWRCVQWFTANWAPPPLSFSKEAYHPPLYYFLSGMVGGAHDPQALTMFSIVFGCGTLLLLWWALERHLPGHRLARLVALALGAILPASVHLAAMITGEALNCFLAMAALLLAASLLQRRRGGGLGRAVLLGLALGLELLTKVSALVIGATIAVAVAVDAWWNAATWWRLRDWRAPARRLAPWVVALAVVAVTAGPYFARNHRLHGKTFLTGFDGLDGPPPAEFEKKYYLDRRPLGFFLGWTDDIFYLPYYPSGVTPTARFWPVLAASTFVDYYNYGYVRSVPHSSLIGNNHFLPPISLKFARASALGGALIALTTLIAWLVFARHAWRRRDAPRLLLLLAPALGLAGQLHFATRFPMDWQGPIKGVYMQFACVPLLALYGLAVAWLAGRRWGRAVAVAQLVAILLVAGYTAYARST